MDHWKGMAEPTWKRYLTDYNEGLGLVYERFVLNDFLLDLKEAHGIETVLEAPLFGMAGVSGINSVALAQAGADVTLVDDHAERLAAVERIWGELDLPARFVCHGDWGHLPFPDGAFDLAWNWAALWYLSPDPASRGLQAGGTAARVGPGVEAGGLCGHAQPRAGGLSPAQVCAGT